MLARLLQSLRSGEWLDPGRCRRIGVALALLYAASLAFLLSGTSTFDPLGRAVGSDFAPVYGVSRALHRGLPAAALYSPQALNDASRDLTGSASYLWPYPPTALAFYWPLASLPYLAALLAWLGLGLAAYLVPIWHVLPNRPAVAAAVLFPAVFACVLHGHNGLLMAGLLGGGLLLLPVRPGAAGALLAGAASLKPHLALLVPVALIAGRAWRALGAMVAAGAVLVGVSVLAFGADTWPAFARSTALTRAMLETEGVPYAKGSSVFSAVRLLGGSVLAAYLAQSSATLAAAAVTAWAWLRPVPGALRAALLLVSVGLATPWLYDYDLPALGIGLALWAREAQHGGWRPWEKTTLFAAYAVPLLARPVATLAGLGVAPLALAAAALLLLRRAAVGPSPAVR